MSLLAVALLASALLPMASGTGAKARLRTAFRSGAVEPSPVWALHRGVWNLDSQAVESSQVLSPAEVEDEEESPQDTGALLQRKVSLISRGTDAAAPADEAAPPADEAAPPSAENSAPPSEDVVQAAGAAAPGVAAAEDMQTAVAGAPPSLEIQAVEKAPPADEVPAVLKRSVGQPKLVAVATPKPSFYGKNRWKSCSPPCIASRGVCNDNVCFCRTPYSGTTCQHEITESGTYRFGPVVAAVSVVASILLGLLIAQIAFSFVREQIEQRMGVLGIETVNKESWSPSDTTGAKKKPGK